MPEGPECYMTASKLNRWISGHRITKIGVTGGRYTKKTGAKDAKAFNELNKVLERTPLEVKDVRSKGKLIYIILGSDTVLMSTLGLSGGWRKNRTKHCDLHISTDYTTVWFNDQLHYGTLKVTDKKGLDKKLKQLGPDVTLGADALDQNRWSEICKKNCRSSVASLLMTQSKLSGIGNYLKAEILYAAGISPTSTIDDLPKRKLNELYHCVVIIPHAWLLWKQRKGPRCFMKVYGRRKDDEGNKVERMKSDDGRVSHWVPKKQWDYTAY